MSKEDRTSFPIHSLFPNIVTMFGLCAGLTSIRFIFSEHWELAVGCIFVAVFSDGMDGRIARMLNSTSNFGAQLDSLADFFNFGVAPAFLLYFWSLRDIKVFGWALAMTFVICMAIRLARFNTSLEDKTGAEWQEMFFVGVPAPAGAALLLLPVILSFYIDISKIFNIRDIAIYAALIAVLVVSHVPTFSTKKLHIHRSLASLTVALFGVFFACLIARPWITLSILGTAYFLSIPVSVISYCYIFRKHHKRLKK
ncbi:CDP-diacylglycerol--serine O-phosphatidyltransferase [Rickettsiales bacterium]|nr:CDP-diacylglycerol--serine O-phosphatidyltransferase [Rickettsiales bacterium]